MTKRFMSAAVAIAVFSAMTAAAFARQTPGTVYNRTENFITETETGTQNRKPDTDILHSEDETLSADNDKVTPGVDADNTQNINDNAADNPGNPYGPEGEIPEENGDDNPDEIFYTVTFETNGHGTQPESQTVKSGDTPTFPGGLKEEGYIFIGWYADREFTEDFDFFAPVTSDVTVYARWTKEGVVDIIFCNVTFDPAGGLLYGDPAGMGMYAEKGSVIILPTPTRKGYIFVNWGSPEYKAGAEYTITRDHEFVAQWKKAAVAQDTPPAGQTDDTTGETGGRAAGNVPDTSDGSDAGLWAAVLAVSVIAAAAVIYHKKLFNQ